MFTWTIHKKDGEYLGQADAMRAKAAFMSYLFVLGLSEINGGSDHDGDCEFTVRGKTYLVRKQGEAAATAIS